MKSLPKNYFHNSDTTHKKNIYSWMGNVCKGKNVLDLCCGDGYGTSILTDKSLRIDGIDLNSDKIRFALRNFFTFNKTRFFIADPLDFLKSCTNYGITIVSETKHVINKENDLRKLLDIIPSPVAIIVFSNSTETIRSYDQIMKEKQIIYEVYYEHQNEINKIGKDSISTIFVLKNIKNQSRHVNKEKEKVSVIIPAYNRESTIEETILSVLNQTYPNVEIIVVDDGSTDKTKEICKKFEDKIKYYYKPNGGISSALNFGIEKMSGVWFKWLSSDDVLTHDAIEKLMEVFNETGGQIIYSDYEIIDEKSNFVSIFKEPIYKDYYEFASKIWIRYIGNASSVLIHKSCFDTVGFFNETLRFGEDYEWWQRACLVYGYRFFHLQQPIVKYRIHSKQLTTKVKDKAFDNDQTIRKRIMDTILETDPEWWKTLSNHRKNYNKMNSKTKLKQILRNLLRHMPNSIQNRVQGWRIRSVQRNKIV